MSLRPRLPSRREAATRSDVTARFGALFFLALGPLGCGAARSPALPAERSDAPIVSSNVERRDYAGAKTCAACHAEISERFTASAMRDMTRAVASARPKAPFDGQVFRFKDDTATFTTRGADLVMEVRSARFGHHDYRVTKIVGGRVREDFVGIELAAAGQAGEVREELILPVSYLIEAKRFRYKGYSVMSEERPGLRAGPVWRETCIFCHNTVPLLSTVLGVLPGAGRTGYQGSLVDRFLPEKARARYRVADEALLGDALGRELRALGATVDDGANAPARVATLVETTRARFDTAHVVDLGVGCEACHGGAKAHAADPRVRPSFAPRGAGLAVEVAATSAQVQSRACARCHQVVFSGYAPTWEGGRRDAEPGGSAINSGEARDFLLGGCTTKLTCSGCHDAHGSSVGLGARFLTPAGDAVCTQCHDAYRGAAAQRAHTHHDASGAGARCVSCHMTKKNMGLDGRLTRYHRIGSPNDAARAERDRPLECALCHGDKSAGQLVDVMERWWPKRIDRARVAALYGGLSSNVLLATAARGHAHEQAVALVALGERRDRSAAAVMTAGLVHPIPIVREYARGALEATFQTPIDFDIFAERATVRRAAERYVEAARGATGARSAVEP